MRHLNDFEKQMLIYRIDNLKNLGNKEFMIAFAGLVNDYNLIQKEDFEHLQDHDWCRDHFKHEYTVIKPLSKNVSDALVEEKKDNTGRQRYYDNVFYLGGKNVLLSSEWYDGKGKKPDNRSGFVDWLRSLVNEKYSISAISISKTAKSETHCSDKHLPYLIALRTKPFMLLAGISGTGKSRIVRELAKACWKEGDEEYGKNNPKNFCMVQVKPNWHDSSELVGYVSRINGEKYVVGPFLRFMAKAINDPNTPYFLCLDEMNLAPVEQYFAEYLSVIESRKLNDDGSITTDPIVPYENTEAYGTLIDQLFYDDADRKEYKSETGTKRLTVPQNLFVIGTVNMDETTFSFSRKVLDRAMTIEMNEVNLSGGLTDEGSEIGYIGNCIIGNAAEGKDVYSENKDLCDKVIAYLEKVNAVLEGSPFKIAYRTSNEFLLYAVNRQLLDKASQLWQTLDEMTSMKILSRIEGDSERTKKVLEELKVLVEEEINKSIPEPEDGKEKLKSISDLKIKEMLEKLSSGYTSYWA
ncbi:MAG: AAA family ATPase [Bacteroidales bacterium]|nr:AAA family ATPase [Bacteroidales bacterium]